MKVVNDYTGPAGKRSYGKIKGNVMVCEGVETGLSIWQALNGER
jgi:hypothetical protein